MNDHEQFLEALKDLGRCIEALGEHRHDAVLTGGMVPFFYRHLAGATPVNQDPLATFDIDWTVPRVLKIHGKSVDGMMHDAHFVDILRGGDDAPVVFYQHERHGTADLSPIHVEFLSPRKGAPKSRDGKDNASIQVQAGLWTQALPFLDLLFSSPIEVEASTIGELSIEGPCAIKVPHPASYILQKALARPKRRPEKRDKDLAYMYDVATNLRSMWPQIAERLKSLETEERFPPKWFSDVRKVFAKLFSSSSADGPIGVARIYRDAMGAGSAPSEDAVFRVMTSFLSTAGLLR